MTMPNFLIIGAGKSGTTSLYHYLGEHPDVFMSPVKEPGFFVYEGETLRFCGPGDDKANRKFITDISSYQALFEAVSHENAVGEASPSYIYRKKASEQIWHHLPDAKLIAILRAFLSIGPVSIT
jgi:hypothetical protein